MTRRVAITAILAVCVSALLVGGISYALVSRDVRSAEDRQLVTAASRPLSLLSRRDPSQLAQLTGPSGRLLYATAALAKLGRLPAFGDGYSNLTLARQPLRVYTVTVRAGFRLSVAVSDAPARDSLTRLRRDVLIGMVTSALLVSLMLIWITRRALAPVRETAAVADRIVSTGDLTARVPEPPGSDEIARLAKSMNRMLTHLEASDTALRRLVADASHELRSPVTTLRGNLELLTSGALNDTDRADALADTHAEAERLGQLVEELLTLARADTVNPDAAVNMIELVEQAISGTEAILSQPAAELTRTTIQGDPVSLRAMIRNLAENADRYAGGAQVTLRTEPGWLALSITDNGPGVPASDREAIFGRFNRGANSAGQTGSGLGLAIVAATARSHGGTVTLSDTPGGGATFTVRLPR